MKKTISIFTIMVLIIMTLQIPVLAQAKWHYSIDYGTKLHLINWDPTVREERVFKWEWSYVFTGDGGRVEFDSNTARNPEITGTAPGTVLICCHYYMYSADYSTVTEKTEYDIYEIEIREIPISSVTFNETSLSLVEGQQGGIQAILYPTNATSRQLTWVSSDSGIAKVSRSEYDDGVGVVTAVSPGTATITVSVPGRSDITSPKCTVTVTEVVSVISISLDKNETSLLVGENEQLTASVLPENASFKDVNWKTDNPEIASVSQYGKVTAVSPGTAIITATTEDGKSATCTVIVTELVPVTGIVLDVKNASLRINESKQLTAAVLPDTATYKNVTWRTDNPEIAEVTDEGIVTAKAIGTANIFASCGIYQASCFITVNDDDIFEYGTMWADGTTSITGITNPDISGVLKVPDQVGEYKITSVYLPELKNITRIEFDDDIEYVSGLNNQPVLGYVKLPANMTYVGWKNSSSIDVKDGLFANDICLHTVVLPEHTEYIGYATFYNCTALENISIPQATKIIYGWAFCRCSSLKNVEIGNQLERIDNGVFSMCQSLENLNIPDSVTTLGYNVFEGNGIRQIRLPNSLKNTDLLNALTYSNIEKVLFDNNPYFCSDEYGAVYSKDRKTFVALPMPHNKIYTVCDGTEVIGQSAFSPYFMSGTGQDVYERHTLSVTLPSSVKEIKSRAFNENIKDIWYQGTEDEWSNIIINEHVSEILSENATIHYLGNGGSNSGESSVSSPIASVTETNIEKGTAVSLSTATAGAEIYYTTDGSQPTVLSEKYVTPIIINENTTIKAIAVKTGLENSTISTFVYTIIEDERTTITVSNATAKAGDTIDIAVELSNNSNIAGMLLKLSYDNNLELKKITKGDTLDTLTFTPPADLSKNSITLLWDGVESDSSNGTILILTFAIKDTAEKGTYNVSLNYNQGDIYDNDLNDIDVRIENGNITVIDYILGDVNDDGVINAKDITVLRRYISGDYNVTVNDNAADVNRDNAINAKDITILRRYISGDYGITLD